MVREMDNRRTYELLDAWIDGWWDWSFHQLTGIGLASCIIVFFVNCYYIVILAWVFYYFFASFTLSLPWESCNNSWNDPDHCVEFYKNNVTNTSQKFFDPVTEYWEWVCRRTFFLLFRYIGQRPWGLEALRSNWNIYVLCEKGKTPWSSV